MHLQQKEHKGRPLCSLAYAYNLLMKRQKKKEKEKTEIYHLSFHSSPEEQDKP